jgi:Rieske 2Fe-2S family protein
MNYPGFIMAIYSQLGISVNLDSLQQAFTQTIRTFSESSSLPGRVYCDPEVFAREVELLFRKMWLCAEHRSSLGTPGEVQTIVISPESVLFTMDRHEQHHAFYNVCRHRHVPIIIKGFGNGGRTIVSTDKL